MHIQSIKAVATSNVDVEAVMNTPQGRAVKHAFHLMAERGIETPGGKITRAELSRRLLVAGLEPVKRIQISIALERGGLLID